MAYTPQQWHDDDTSAPYGPINGARLNYIEAGIEAAAAVADAAGGGGTASFGTATPLMDGAGAAGTAALGSHQDHVHPTDTSRAALASPTLTGTPAGPTAAVDTATTQLATTAYVVNQAYAKLASPTFTGTPSLPTGTTGTTQSAADSTTKLATTAFVTTADNLKANLASPTFTGSPVLPTGTTGVTQSASDNSTKLATTAYADAAAGGGGVTLGTATPIIDGTGAPGTAGFASHQDHVHPTDTTRAPLASPTFTGTPLSTTAAVDTSTTQIATTAYVVGQGYAKLASPTFTGSPVLPTGTTGVTQSAADNSTKLATTAYADTGLALKANLASPTLTGAPSLPTGTTGVTQSANDNSTKLASTAYADRASIQLGNPSFYLDGAQANVRSTIDRRHANSATIATTTTGIMLSYPIVLYAGDTVTNLSFMIGTYTAGANQNQWVALYDSQATPALLSQSADAGTAAIPQNTFYTKALGTAQVISTTGVYYVAIMVKTVNAVPLMVGVNTSSLISAGPSGAKALARTSGSSLTTTAPGTIASASVTAGMGYCVTS